MTNKQDMQPRDAQIGIDSGSNSKADYLSSWSNEPGTVSLHLQLAEARRQDLSPPAQEKIGQALATMGHLLNTLLLNQPVFAAEGLSLTQLLDLLTERVNDILHDFANMAAGAEFPTLPAVSEELATEETLDAADEYVAYVFENAYLYGHHIATLVSAARQCGYPVRVWWQSEVMDLEGYPDSLMVCVHFPAPDSVKGADLSVEFQKTLLGYGVMWDERDRVTMAEYRRYGQQIAGAAAICRPDGTPLFTAAAPLFAIDKAPPIPAWLSIGDVGIACAPWLLGVNRAIWQLVSGCGHNLPVLNRVAPFSDEAKQFQAAAAALQVMGWPTTHGGE